MAHKNGYHFGVKVAGEIDFYIYIRTYEETYQHPTVNICGIELPKPETVAPAYGTKYWLAPTCNEKYWCYPYNKVELGSELGSGRVHLTKERAKAWADWLKTTVIENIN